MGYSWNAQVEDYNTYLGRRAILDEQLGGMRATSDSLAREITSGISSQTRDILGSIDSLTTTLSSSISDLSWEISSGLGHVASALDSGFAALLRKSDDIKRELQRLVELVELEEQRKAMENFRYAVFALNRGLWDEALDYVTAAIDGDSHSKGYRLDWHFHWVKGELLLGAPSRHDWPKLSPAQAEQSFLLAARYARADEPGEAAKALLLASVAAFSQSHEDQGKLADMLRHAEAALALDAKLSEAAFQASKAQMALGKPNKALPVLRRAIDSNAAFAVRAAEDPDHRRHEDRLNEFFAALRGECVEAIRAKAGVVVAELAPVAARARTIGASPAYQRLVRMAAGSAADRGMLDLLVYHHEGIDADIRASRFAAEDVRRPRFHEYEGEMEEKYEEEVIVEPGRLWRRAVTRTETRTRRIPVSDCVLMDGVGTISRRFGFRFVTIPFSPARFSMASVPVSQGLYQAIAGKNPSHFKNADAPVESVNWYEAAQFCNLLSRSAGLEEAYVINGENVRWKGNGTKGYRLPTEAEWEFACRGGTSGDHYGRLDEIAWYEKNSGGRTHPVAQKRPNPFGLFDMLGNVWEWCWDSVEGGSYRVGRGGSWGNCADRVSASSRDSYTPGYRYYALGFRLARSLP